MASTLTVGIGADSSKLTADLARAQAQLSDFGKQLRDAAKSGDDEGVNRISKQYDDEFRNVAKLKAAVKDARNAGNEDGEKSGTGGWLATAQAAFGRMQTAMVPVKAGLSELHSHARDFGNALENVAGNIFPRFRDLFAIGAIGSGAALISMVRSTADWGHELQKAADTLGVSINTMSGLKKAAASVGVDSDSLVRGLTRFGVSVEKAQEEQKKLGVEATKIIYENVQKSSGGIADLTKRAATAGDQVKRSFNVGDADFSKIGDQLRLIYNLGGIGGNLPGESFENFKIRAAAALQSTGKEAEKLREIIFKMGGQISAGNLATALDRGLPKYKDTLKSIGVDVIDPLTGKIKDAESLIVDFVGKYKDLDINKQQVVAKDLLGRGFVELLPFLKMNKEELKKFLDEAKANKGLDAQVKAADALYKTLLRLDAAFSGLKRALILPFVDVFKGPTESMEVFVKGMQKGAADMSRSIATTLKPIAEDIGRIFKGGNAQTDFGQRFVYWKQQATNFFTFVQTAFEKLSSVANGIADSINRVFGTNFTGKGILIALAIAKMTGAFTLFTAGVRLAAGALALIYLNPVTITIAAIAAGALLIYANWDQIWALMQRVGTYIGGAFVTAWNTAVEGIKSAWSGLTTWISGQIDQIISVVNKIVDVAKQAASIIASLGGGSAAPSAGTGGGYSSTLGGAAGGSGGFASGGYISGPGSGTSDSIPARLSNGEYVLRAASVAKLGVGYLNHLNSAGYALGGLVGRSLGFSPSIPSFAGGGLVGAGGGSFGTVNLTLGGQTVGLNVSNQDGFGQLSRIARSEQRTSAGAKPSWYGS